MPRASHPLFALLLVALCACTSDANNTMDDAPRHPPVDYLLTEEATTVLQQLWAPNVPSQESMDAIDEGSLLVTDLAKFGDYGLGVRLEAGLPWAEHLELAPDFPGQGAADERRSLVYLWQAADPQLIDEESPIRLEAFASLYRPHGHLTTQVFEAHVRSARRLSELSGRPIDFALLAGDLTDGSQKNELDWVLSILTGGVIDPDSGRDDDPVDGPGNDFNDPFRSEGIGAPWYATLGNHETLYNGGFGAISDDLRKAAQGSSIYDFPLFPNGFRDGATEHADVVAEGEGSTPADASRIPLRLPEVLEALATAGGDPPGHGLAATDAAAGIGYFSVLPIPGKPIRLIVLNTVNSTPTTIGIGALGVLDAKQHSWLQEQLGKADAAGELVIVMSHHRATDFADASEVSGAQLVETLAASDSVILHVVGHGHENEKASHAGSKASAYGYWELMLASTVDFPMQSRFIEIVDEANGYLSIYVTNIDHNSPPSSLAHLGRSLAAAKLAFGTVTEEADVEAFWQDDVVSQNLLLRVKISAALQEQLAEHEWPTRIESEETLAALSTQP